MEAKKQRGVAWALGTRQVGQDRLLEAVFAFRVLGKWAICQMSLSQANRRAIVIKYVMGVITLTWQLRCQ